VQIARRTLWCGCCIIDNQNYEIATFREDLNNTADRNTEVRLGVTIEQDVLRRDFTINALFYDIANGRIVDLVGGIKDLRDGIIRAVGNPNERFAEDNLRKLRAVRFAARLNFQIEHETFKAIQNDPQLNVTLERIYNELVTMYSSTFSVEYLTHLLYYSNLIHFIFPNIDIVELTRLKFDQISSFSTWVAAMIKDNPANADVLFDLKFPTSIINGVKMLNTYCITHDAQIRNFNPMSFYKSWKQCSLFPEEILKYGNNQKHLQFLVKFRPDSEVSKKLQNEGYVGKDLGDRLNQHYKLKYVLSLNGK
jgi:tRNA nucleotidyltransferase/poly(A) polymerase